MPSSAARMLSSVCGPSRAGREIRMPASFRLAQGRRPAATAYCFLLRLAKLIAARPRHNMPTVPGSGTPADC